MILSFVHPGLKELYCTGQSELVLLQLHIPCLMRLDVLQAAQRTDDLRMWGLNFSSIPDRAGYYNTRVDGAWHIVFEFIYGNARRIDLVEYCQP